MAFRESTWGLAAIWLTTLVYMLNAILLYRTLRSQLRVQENAQRQTDLQRYLVREQIKPRFSVQLLAKKSITEAELEIVAKARFRSSGHEAHKVSLPHDVRYVGLRQSTESLPDISVEQYFRNTDLLYGFAIMGQILSTDLVDGNLELHFNVKACDDFQNEYEQKFIFRFKAAIDLSAGEGFVSESAEAFEPVLMKVKGIIS